VINLIKLAQAFGSLQVRSFLIDFPRNTCAVEWANVLGLVTYTITVVFFPLQNKREP